MAMEDLFQHTLLLRARSPLSRTNSFKQLDVDVQLLESQTPLHAPLNEDYPHHVLRLCHQLCALAGGSACVAFPSSQATIHVIFESTRKEFIRKAIKKQGKTLQISITTTADEEGIPACLLQKAVHYGLRLGLFRQGWMALDGSLLLRSKLNKYEEGQPVGALSVVNVQLEPDGQILLLASLDTVQFRRFKLESILTPSLVKQFEEGSEVQLKDELWQQVDGTIHAFTCCVLPSLMTGYVVGCSKYPPGFLSHEEAYSELWTYKYGLGVPENCGFLKVCPTTDVNSEGSWFPSCCVLTKAGLMPATPSTRVANHVSVLAQLRADASAWKFCNEGGLFFEVSSPSPTGIGKNMDFGWMTAKEALLPSIIETESQTRTYAESKPGASRFLPTLSQFRRTKPIPSKPPLEKAAPKQELSMEYFEDPETTRRPTSSPSLPPVIPTKPLLVPHFGARKRKPADIQSSTVKKKNQKGNIDKATEIPVSLRAEEQKQTVPASIQVPLFGARKRKPADIQPSTVKAKIKKGKFYKATEIPLPLPAEEQKQTVPSSIQPTEKNRQRTKETAKGAVSNAAAVESNVRKRSARKEQVGTLTVPRTPKVAKNDGVEDPRSYPATEGPTGQLELLPTPSSRNCNAVPQEEFCTSTRAAPEVPSPNSRNCNGAPQEEVCPTIRASPEVAAVKTSHGSKVSVADIDCDANDKKVRLKHAEGKLTSLTVRELKSFLAAQKVKSSARKKDDLIERVMQLLK